MPSFVSSNLMNRLSPRTLQRLRQSLLTCLIVGLMAGVAAAVEPPEQVVERMQKRYQELTSFSFTFAQQTSGQLSGRPKTGNGSGILYHHGSQTLMRWNYERPERQVIISNGEEVSMYFENLQQMIIAPGDAGQSDVLASFFSGDKALDESFLTVAPDPEIAAAAEELSPSLHGAQLLPRQPHAQLRSVHLFIDNESLIRRIDLMDHFDTRTIIDIDSLVINPLDGMDNAAILEIFSFVPPPGTEIIRQ